MSALLEGAPTGWGSRFFTASGPESSGSARRVDPPQVEGLVLLPRRLLCSQVAGRLSAAISETRAGSTVVRLARGFPRKVA